MYEAFRAEFREWAITEEQSNLNRLVTDRLKDEGFEVSDNVETVSIITPERKHVVRDMRGHAAIIESINKTLGNSEVKELPTGYVRKVTGGSTNMYQVSSIDDLHALALVSKDLDGLEVPGRNIKIDIGSQSVQFTRNRFNERHTLYELLTKGD